MPIVFKVEYKIVSPLIHIINTQFTKYYRRYKKKHCMKNILLVSRAVNGGGKKDRSHISFPLWPKQCVSTEQKFSVRQNLMISGEFLHYSFLKAK